MKKLFTLVLSTLVFGIFLGFSNNDNPVNRDRSNYSGTAVQVNNSNTVYHGTENDNLTGEYYTDNFDGPNEVTDLVARGYVIKRNGNNPGFQGAQPWFTGYSLSDGIFNSFNGPNTGYVSSNFASTSSFGTLDNWLILPKQSVMAGDSICFRARGFFGVDSITVMYSPNGATTVPPPGVSSPDWIKLGDFQAVPSGQPGFWEYKAYAAPSSGDTARFAIRSFIHDAGPGAPQSDWIGIDALNLKRDDPLPVELSSFVSMISGNDVTLNWSTASETNNSGFDVERNSNGVWTKIGNVTGNGTVNSAVNYSFTDRNLNSGVHSYRLKQIDFNGNFEYFNLSSEVVIGVPSAFVLSQNYPNPFNPSTKIDYQLPTDGNVNISVFDNSGKEVMTLVNEFKSAGYYTINFNASQLSSGIYFYKISADNFSGVKKMILVK